MIESCMGESGKYINERTILKLFSTLYIKTDLELNNYCKPSC